MTDLTNMNQAALEARIESAAQAAHERIDGAVRDALADVAVAVGVSAEHLGSRLLSNAERVLVQDVRLGDGAAGYVRMDLANQSFVVSESGNHRSVPGGKYRIFVVFMRLPD